MRLLLLLLLSSAGSTSAAVRYVDANNANPTDPYTNWTTAARVIQDAVDAAAPGDEIVVTNGIYATGGRAMGTNRLTNRVMVNKPLRLRSVNGPQVTIILGAKAPGGANGEGAIRCVYLTDGASLSSFTLTNGATRMDVDADRDFRGGGVWGDSSNAVLTNCVITGNSAHYGGGAAGCTLYDCTLTANSAAYGGGGASGGTLYDCTLTGNSAWAEGGGVSGWGLDGVKIYNSTLNDNLAGLKGGGAYGGTLYNCRLTGNCASGGWFRGQGGGASGSTLYNCTLTGNSADEGGGAFGSQSEPCLLNNCVLYFNRAPNGTNYSGDFIRFEYSCTSPLPPGAGNIAVDPQLAGPAHLSPTSPCIGAGSSAYASGVDIDGQPWATPPAMGADQPGPAIGPLSPEIDAGLTNVTAGYEVSFTARNGGPILQSMWDFGDGTRLTNQPFARRAWSRPGKYTVQLTGYNDSYPDGVTTTVSVTVSETEHSYVNAASANPVFPYGSWETAATNIQDAIGAGTLPGRVVLVTNGVYRLGTVENNWPNRVLLTNVVVVKSVNGPEVTVIEGVQPDPETGERGVRCAYVGNGSVLSGFTLNKGSGGFFGGGVWCESFGVVTNCTLTGNSAEVGGGAYGGTLYNCTLTNNVGVGGGWFDGIGGGAAESVLYNCTLNANSAAYLGGGAYRGALYNCTLTGNSASGGGGVSGGALYNCIVYFNKAPRTANYSGATLAYSCTTPLAPGPGNIEADPQLVTASHLLPNSPCVRAGNRAYAAGVDVDDEPWASPPAMGVDQPGSATGPLNIWIIAGFTNVATGYHVSFTAWNTGAVLGCVWDFGDGTRVTNLAFPSHAWITPGVHVVRLTGFNGTHPGGVTATTIVTVSEAVHYVSSASPNPVFPYTSWETAATGIQEAIGAGALPGRVVLVTNGVYRLGTVEHVVQNPDVPNRVALTNGVVVRSVNGPDVTVIEGATNGVRCAYVANGSLLSGFTLTKGESLAGGGGVQCELFGVVTNCVLTANSAEWAGGGAAGGTLYHCTLSHNSAEGGGGALGSRLYNCTLTGNWASFRGGGVSESTLYNCTVTGNSTRDDGGGVLNCTLYNCMLTGNLARWGGGASESTLYNCTLTSNSAQDGGGGAHSGALYNCIVYYNRATYEANYDDSTFEFSCTVPLPPGLGNIAADPRFANTARGDFRLRPDSPCINAGNNTSPQDSTDLDANPRIVRGTVDIGAYEFQGPGSMISYAWLQQYGLPMDGSADATDPDADGHSNWQEWRCRTNPTNAFSALRLLSASSDGTNVTVHWQSAAGVTYFLERSSNVSAASPFSLRIPVPLAWYLTSWKCPDTTETKAPLIINGLHWRAMIGGARKWASLFLREQES